MAKKLILLILILPLLLMICLFSATTTVSRNVDVKVDGIEYLGEKTVYLDMDKNETYKIEYTVYPTSAKVQEIVEPEAAPVQGETEADMCKLDFTTSDGGKTWVIEPKTPGKAMITIRTKDGGHPAYFTVEVFSGTIESLTASIEKDKLLVGERTKVNFETLPKGANNRLVKYVSSNTAVAKVNEYGVVDAVGKGDCVITVISEYNENIMASVSLHVENESTMDLAASEVKVMDSVGSFNISLDTDVPYQIKYKFYKGNKEVGDELITATVTEQSGSNLLFTYTFTDDTFVGDIKCEITYTSEYETLTKTCTISKISNIEIGFYEDGAFGIGEGQLEYLPINLTPEGASVNYKVSTSNDNVTAIFVSGKLMIEGKKVGITTLTITATDKNYPDAEDVAAIDIVVKPKSLSISQISEKYGIEGTFTIGKYDSDGSVSNPYQLTYNSPSELGDSIKQYITWHSSTDEVTIDTDGNIIFQNDTFTGFVDFYAELAYDGVTMRTPIHSIRCVADGVNVYNYVDLLTATRAEKKVVLRDNVKNGFGYDANGKLTYEMIDTTYDADYYNGAPAQIAVLIQFKNDVYGNGFEINAHNVTYALDETGALQVSKALFKGPLNFVAMTDPQSGGGNGGMISVKGQDNVVFAVYENVTLSNVQLKGCDLTPDSDGKYDLVDLTYVGTTVEVFGDNVNIEYSRILNGRTVLRAFGDIDDPEKVINVNIKNSVLSMAREFVIRTGSNCFVQGTYEDPSPYLPGDDSTKNEHETKKTYNSLTDEEKAAYDAQFIKTNITIENSVLSDAGIFAIGMDSHFAGIALADGKQAGIDIGNTTLSNFLAHWQDLAKTSYGAKLTFKGDVRIYNWKELDEIDSSTLIEVPTDSQFSEDLKFDVGQLVGDIGKKENFANIVYRAGATEYAHAGIAFFGGGKNYSVFDVGEYEWEKFNHYEISLMDVGKAPLTAAAGSENFYFFLHDRTNINFLPEDQAEILKSDNAYSNIYRK